MGRVRQPFTREEEYLDARKILVIAFEGAEDKAEDRYFNGIQALANDLCKPDPPRIHIKSIPNIANKSAPHHIFENLARFKEYYELDYNENESYLLVDWDSHEDNIRNHNLIEKCKENQFHFTLCKPCFELWLLLHFKDIENESAQIKNDILENKRISNARRYIDRLLQDECGSSKKSNLLFSRYKDHIEDAIVNAKKLEHNSDLIPDGLVARTYIIVESIFTECSDLGFNQQKIP